MAHIDLRCQRRLTVAEGRLISSLLAANGGRVSERAKAKIDAAVQMADHDCVYAKPPKVRNPLLPARATYGGAYCLICGEPKGRRPREVPAEFKRPRLRLSPLQFSVAGEVKQETPRGEA